MERRRLRLVVLTEPLRDSYLCTALKKKGAPAAISGTDAHLDWAISPYLNDKFHIGAVGYFYNQISGDSGAGARLGGFESRVAGIGP